MFGNPSNTIFPITWKAAEWLFALAMADGESSVREAAFTAYQKHPHGVHLDQFKKEDGR